MGSAAARAGTKRLTHACRRRAARPQHGRAARSCKLRSSFPPWARSPCASAPCGQELEAHALAEHAPNWIICTRPPRGRPKRLPQIFDLCAPPPRAQALELEAVSMGRHGGIDVDHWHGSQDCPPSADRASRGARSPPGPATTWGYMEWSLDEAAWSSRTEVAPAARAGCARKIRQTPHAATRSPP
jgi:hypothetical protein